VLDTDVVIAALDKGDAHHGDASRGLRRLIEEEVDLLISTINYAEALVKPAEDERTLRAAIDAISTLGIRPVAPGAPVARDAARIRGLGISLADGFALATASAHDATVASFDKRVRRALRPAGLRLCSALR
jgi:predicted nucleic acid-binding protein